MKLNVIREGTLGPVFKGFLIFVRVITIVPVTAEEKPLIMVIFPVDESKVHDRDVEAP